MVFGCSSKLTPFKEESAEDYDLRPSIALMRFLGTITVGEPVVPQESLNQLIMC